MGTATLTRCELSNDLAHARIFFTVLGGSTDCRTTERALDSATGFVQWQVGRVLRTRKIPRIRWVFDEAVEYSDQMDRAIREAIERDRTIRPEAHDEVEFQRQDPDEEDVIEAEVDEYSRLATKKPTDDISPPNRRLDCVRYGRRCRRPWRRRSGP